MRWRGRNITEVLKLSLEEGVKFFAEERGILRQLEFRPELGLGYLELTMLSRGEAQRVKLAAEWRRLGRIVNHFQGRDRGHLAGGYA